jgi:hypothetical protein
MIALACCVHTHVPVYICQDNAQALQVVHKLCRWFLICQILLEHQADEQQQQQQREGAAVSPALDWLGTGEMISCLVASPLPPNLP